MSLNHNAKEKIKAIVDVQQLKKKNDYLFFELFSAYTAQSINNQPTQ